MEGYVEKDISDLLGKKIIKIFHKGTIINLQTDKDYYLILPEEEDITFELVRKSGHATYIRNGIIEMVECSSEVSKTGKVKEKWLTIDIVTKLSQITYRYTVTPNKQNSVTRLKLMKKLKEKSNVREQK